MIKSPSVSPESIAAGSDFLPASIITASTFSLYENCEPHTVMLYKNLYTTTCVINLNQTAYLYSCQWLIIGRIMNYATGYNYDIIMIEL